jgi:hypothetical protein
LKNFCIFTLNNFFTLISETAKTAGTAETAETVGTAETAETVVTAFDT